MFRKMDFESWDLRSLSPDSWKHFGGGTSVCDALIHGYTYYPVGKETLFKAGLKKPPCVYNSNTVIENRMVMDSIFKYSIASLLFPNPHGY